MPVRHLNPWLEDRPDEARLIGMMLSGYGELEYDLSVLTGCALGSQTMGLRLIYRLRSEAQRLEAADAVLNLRCADAKLAGAYATMYGAIKWCKNTRNRYAHCHWIVRGEPTNADLCFFDIEAAAKLSGDDDTDLVTLRPITLALLEQQATYFRYASDCLAFLGYRYCQEVGIRWPLGQLDKPPPPLSQPKTHNDQK